MPTQVWIHVYSSKPNDWAWERHAGLYFRFPDGTGDFMHVVRVDGVYQFDVIEYYEPTDSPTLVGRIFVGMIDDTFTPTDIRRICAWTPVKKSRDMEFWGCKDWVLDTLVRFEKNGAVTANDRVRVIDRMIYICLDGEDELLALLRKKGGPEALKSAYVV